MTRDLLVVQKISLLEIVSTAVLLAVVVVVVVDLLESSMLLTQATLQATHRCTPAPYGTLAVPAVLPTVLSLQGVQASSQQCKQTNRLNCWFVTSPST